MIQIQNSTPILLAVFFLFLVFMFFPTISELKRPRDAGPRIIVEDNLGLRIISEVLKIEILDADDEEPDSETMATVIRALAFLPSLEV